MLSSSGAIPLVGVSWTPGKQPIRPCMSMTACFLFKTRMVQFGEDSVHFVHLSETISARSSLVNSPLLEEALYGSFWSMCEHQ
jgi:hypothetical protein